MPGNFTSQGNHTSFLNWSVNSGRAAWVHSSLLITTVLERALSEGVIEVKCVKPDLTFSIHNLCNQELSPVEVWFWVTENNFGPIVHESSSSCPRVALVSEWRPPKAVCNTGVTNRVTTRLAVPLKRKEEFKLWQELLCGINALRSAR